MLIECEADLVEVFRARRKALGLSQLDVDEIAGLQGGYCSKLEIPNHVNGRRAANMSLWLWMGALDLALIAIPRNPNLQQFRVSASSQRGASKADTEAPECDTKRQAANPRPLAVTVKQAAEIVGLSPRTIFRLIHERRLRTSKVGRRTLVSYESLQKLVTRPPAKARMAVTAEPAAEREAA